MMIESDSLCARVIGPSYRVIHCCPRPVRHHTNVILQTFYGATHHHPAPMTSGDDNTAALFPHCHHSLHYHYPHGHQLHYFNLTFNSFIIIALTIISFIIIILMIIHTQGS